MQNDVFLIDICGTIFRSNTTFDFLSYFFSQKHWYKILSICRGTRILIIANAILMRILKMDILRYWAISHLKGMTSKKLATMADEFYNKYLKNCINEEVIQIIEKCKADNKELVIVSATLDCIAETVAKNLGIANVYSSQMAFENDRFCGHLKIDLLQKKYKVLTANGVMPPYWGIITDNYSDKKLIENSKQAFLVQYANKPNRWESLLKGLKVKTKTIIIHD